MVPTGALACRAICQCHLAAAPAPWVSQRDHMKMLLSGCCADQRADRWAPLREPSSCVLSSASLEGDLLAWPERAPDLGPAARVLPVQETQGAFGARCDSHKLRRETSRALGLTTRGGCLGLEANKPPQPHHISFQRAKKVGQIPGTVALRRTDPLNTTTPYHSRAPGLCRMDLNSTSWESAGEEGSEVETRPTCAFPG